MNSDCQESPAKSEVIVTVLRREIVPHFCKQKEKEIRNGKNIYNV